MENGVPWEMEHPISIKQALVPRAKGEGTGGKEGVYDMIGRDLLAAAVTEVWRRGRYSLPPTHPQHPT